MEIEIMIIMLIMISWLWIYIFNCFKKCMYRKQKGKYERGARGPKREGFSNSYKLLVLKSSGPPLYFECASVYSGHLYTLSP